MEQPAGWATYVDQQFGFAINYPQIYKTAIDSGPTQAVDPKPVHRVRFQEDLGDTPMAQFEIEVFENGAGASLEEWLNAHAPQGSRSPMAVGNRSGYQVTLAIEIAPNQFYYVAGGSYIYKLTPLGPHGQEMLNSFTLR